MPLYEFEEGSSRKFYRIDLDGRKVLLHWGRIGTEGEHQIASFETEALAKAEYDRQIAKRTEQRGYRLVVDEGVPHDPEKVSRDRLAKAAPLTDSPRFLFVHAGKKKFAWVEARGSELVSIKGLRADEDKLAPTTKRCSSPEVAVRERDALIAKWMGQGYELETFDADRETKATKPRKRALADCRALETTIEEDPFDEGRWEVLEDFLLQHPEDPRSDIIEAHKQRQISEEAQARGAAFPLLLGKRHASVSTMLVRSEWRAGYLVRTGFGSSKSSRPTKETGLEERLQALLETPAARLLRELELVASLPRTLPRLCSIVATAPCGRSLRVLELVSGVGAAIPFDCSVVGGLPITTLRSHRAQLHLHNVSALPALHRLETTVRSAQSLRSLFAEPARSLAMLSLHYEGDRGAGFAEPPDPARLAELTDVLRLLPAFAPSLVTLELAFRTPQAAAAARTALAGLPVQSLTVSPSGAS